MSKLTQEEIDALPRPLKPIRDMVLCKRQKQEKIGAIYLPDQKTIQDQICRVLEVGPGLMLDDGVIRPAPCQRGDLIYTTPQDGMKIVLDGEELYVYEAMEVVGIFLDESVTAYGNETMANE